MKYRKLTKSKENVSVLGLGCMRFPTDGDRINEQESIEMIRYAIDNGVNYIDTAWMYHNGESETLVGKALKDGYREKILLADKMPVCLMKSPDEYEEIFEKQLEKLQTDYIDFYLMHSLSLNTWRNMVVKHGLLEKAKQAKAEGKIRHIGFSFHDNFDAFCEIADGFDGWDFCQIQLNYTDIENQAGIKGLEYAHQKGLDVIIMEPLRGGKLAIPPKRVADSLSNEKSPVEWGLDFLWNRKEVGVILSGMSNMEQLKQNMEYASRSSVGMLTDSQVKMLEDAGKIFNETAMVGCTACEYCLPCPAGIEIPKVFGIYNQWGRGEKKDAVNSYSQLTFKADACLECKACEEKCPQAIKISQLMKDITKVL